MSSKVSLSSNNNSSSDNEESEEETEEVIQERNRNLLEKYLKSQLELDVIDTPAEAIEEVAVEDSTAVQKEEVLRKFDLFKKKSIVIYLLSTPIILSFPFIWYDFTEC